MLSPFQSITDLSAATDVLRRRRFGVIQMHAGRLEQVSFRPWPKLISLPEVFALTRWVHARRRGDRCWLYFNQPLGCPNFLAVPYAISTKDCRLQTAVGALTVLDEIARIKDSHAALCDITCDRISECSTTGFAYGCKTSVCTDTCLAQHRRKLLTPQPPGTT